MAHADDFLERGRDALRKGDAAAARAEFEAALAAGPSAGAIEGLARAAYLDFDYSATIELSEQAYTLYRKSGRHADAVRTARWLAFLNGMIKGDAAVMNGWLARATTLLGDDETSSEGGWIALVRGMFEPDRSRKEDLLRDAVAVARNAGDRDLEFSALAFLGASLVHGDHHEEGMLLLDEVLAAAVGDEVDDVAVLEDMFCQLFSACEHAHDVARADQWIRVGQSISQRRNLPAISAYCRTHYGALLTAAGRWAEAEAALTEAVRIWGLGYRNLRSGALIRLADLRVRQGRLEEAEQLLDGLELWPEAARPLAAIHLARGDTELATEILDRALHDRDPSSVAAAPLHELAVEVHLSAGRLDDAESAADHLAACAAAHSTDYLTAAAALARGRVCLASGTGDPHACLREALAGFSRAGLPMELARSRLALAGALATARPEVALAEARAALDGFERLKAALDADAAAALLRTLGARTATTQRTDGVLTKREAEVLELLGHGLSNPEISERLFISRKTVEHHVGNVLAKLGLRSRAEAAAYAARTKPGTK